MGIFGRTPEYVFHEGLSFRSWWAVLCWGVFLWTAASVADVLFGASGSLYESFFSPGRRELWLRMSALLLVVSCAVAALVARSRLGRTQAALEGMREDVRDLVETLDGILWEADPQSFQFRIVSPQAERILGYPLNDWYVPGFWEELLHPEDRGRILEAWLEACTEGRGATLEYRVIAADGRERWVRDMVSVLHVGGRTLSLRGLMTDITESHAAQDQLTTLSQAIEQSPSIIVLTDPQGGIEFVNPRFTEVTGYTPEEVLGRNPRVLRHRDQPAEIYRNLWETLIRGNVWRGELLNRKKDGTEYWESATIAPVTDSQGRIAHYMKLAEDISERKQAQETIRSMLSRDRVTGLTSRELFVDRVGLALNAARSKGGSLAVVFLDLDRFQKVTHSFGHRIGDTLLRQVGERLLAAVRADDTVARMAGDTFTILLPHIASSEEAARIAGRLLDAVRVPFECEGHEVFLSASAGVAVYPGDGEDVHTLLRNADTALFRAKREELGTCQLYASFMNGRALDRMRLESQLRHALEREEFLLEYQPQMDLATGLVVGAEALIRWRHPERGLVPPDAFIPLAEETGLIVPIGEWVLATACAQAAALQRPGRKPLRISVNLSARHFHREDLVSRVHDLLRESALPAECLGIEITENAVMQDVEGAARNLFALKDLGVHLAIDDFGTGHASLVYLKRFPIDMIKIDRSFLSGVDRHSSDAAIVSAIIALAHTLKMEVLAEGVERVEQLQFLRRHACNQIQGYLLSRSVHAEEFRARLDDYALPAN